MGRSWADQRSEDLTFNNVPWADSNAGGVVAIGVTAFCFCTSVSSDDTGQVSDWC